MGIGSKVAPLLVEIHDLDDAQIIVGADHRQHHAHDGEPIEMRLECGVEYVELREEAASGGIPASENSSIANRKA